MKNNYLFNWFVTLFFIIGLSSCNYESSQKDLLADLDWNAFMKQHDMHWTQLTADPVEISNDAHLKTGYYAGAIMGNGLLGTNLYKLTDNVYRLNVGRSDVTEVRKPYNLFNSARLPIGYFTLAMVGDVQKEEMHLSLYDAQTTGEFITDKGSLNFNTYVHALNNYIVFETTAKGEEVDYVWNFVPQKAISPRCMIKTFPAEYLNSRGEANPKPVFREVGDTHLLIQPLVTDSTMNTIGKVYVVAWREIRKANKRRILATVAQQIQEQSAVSEAIKTLDTACEMNSDLQLEEHVEWWHQYYRQAAFLSFPDKRMESFYWAQYYKFASTTRPGKPIVDLQGVWPTWDTPWTAVWINLNLQLTYSWQTKANLGWLAEPLWNSLYTYRDNLRRNVTDIPEQSTWTDAACLGRTSSYDFLSPMDPSCVETNQYEVGNLTWLLYYYWQYCNSYGDTQKLTTRLFPLLKSAINLYFHIRTVNDGKYGLPPTASPEYIGSNIGPNSNYDLASLRWGLKTLIDIDEQYHLNDPMLPKWKDFLSNLVDFPYDEETGYKVSDIYKFENVRHRHYSHLFMIYPYHVINWGQKENRDKIRLSVNRWKGNQGYSRTGKAAMLLSMGKGDEALHEMQLFLDRFVKPNTLYAETGPVIETPLAALSSIHDFYLQDWGGTLRVFHGIPSTWKEASFVNMRANGSFLVSASRKDGKTTYIQVLSEKGNTCILQTDIPLMNIEIRNLSGDNVDYKVIDSAEGIISIHTSVDDCLVISDKTIPSLKPTFINHDSEPVWFYGDGMKHEFN